MVVVIGALVASRDVKRYQDTCSVVGLIAGKSGMTPMFPAVFVDRYTGRE